ncbi:MAG: hypothetical protein WBD40_25940 [Tepidisphaeraceae bacterium]
MKQLLAVLAVLSSASVASVASASLIAYDPFDYTAGNVLRTNGGWVGSNTSVPRPTVVSGSLSYPGLPASVGDTLFVVGSFTFNGVANLDVYNSPASVPLTEPAGSHSASTLVADPLITQIVAFYLRQNTGEPTPITVDELRIGTTWADVAPVPEPAALSLVGLGFLALPARRRRT